MNLTALSHTVTVYHPLPVYYSDRGNLGGWFAICVVAVVTPLAIYIKKKYNNNGLFMYTDRNQKKSRRNLFENELTMVK